MSKEIVLDKGYVAIVDDEDYERIIGVGRWTVAVRRNSIYAQNRKKTSGRTRTIYMHRFILNITDPKIEVDHRDHDGLNNRRYNIRESTRRQNAQNMMKMRHNTSGYKGVRLTRGSWDGRVSTEPGCIACGRFVTPEEAAHAVDYFAKLHNGDFAYLNFPDDQWSFDKIESRRLKKTDRICINNGTKSRFLNNNDPIPVGWVLGRLPNTKRGIVPAYREALEHDGSTILVEYAALYDEEA